MHYQAHRRTATITGQWESNLVDAAAARAHIRMLLDAGMRSAQIVDYAGISKFTIRRLANLPDGPDCRASRAVVAAVLAIDVSAIYRAYLNASEHVYVNGTGSRRRLQALVAARWSYDDLATHCDWSPHTLASFIHSTDRELRAGAARSIAAMFNDLQLIPGGGPSDRARRVAENRGWPPPLAWDEDDIDNPDAAPHLCETTTEHVVDEVLVERCVTAWRTRLAPPKVPRGDKVAVVTALLAAGATYTYAAEVVGWSLPTLRKRLSA